MADDYDDLDDDFEYETECPMCGAELTEAGYCSKGMYDDCDVETEFDEDDFDDEYEEYEDDEGEV